MPDTALWASVFECWHPFLMTSRKLSLLLLLLLLLLLFANNSCQTTVFGLACRRMGERVYVHEVKQNL